MFFDSRHVNNCNIDVWHNRLGHLWHNKYICSRFLYIHFNKINVCESCYLAKQHMLPFTNNNHVSEHIFDLIHIDIWRPINVPSIRGHMFFLTIVDDFSRYTGVHLMQNKAEARSALLKFIVLVQNQFNAKIKVIRSYNGQEFMWSDLYKKWKLYIKLVV